MNSPLTSSDRCPFGRLVGPGVPAVALLVAILWGVLFFLTPVQVDDQMFVSVYRSHNGMSDTPSLSAWWQYALELRVNDTSRISNLLAIPSMLWSPWKYIFPWLTGLMVALMIWMASRYAFGRHLDWASFGVVWLLVAFFLPWRNFLVTVTYSLNYVYPAVLTMFLVWLIMGTDRWNWRFWVGIPLVLLAGWWHEGFAATALCGLGFVMLLRRGRMPVQWWILCLIYGVTVLVLVSSPLVRGRIEREVTDSGGWLKLSFLYDVLMVGALGASMVGALLFSAGRRHLLALFKGWKFPVFFTIAVTGTFLAFLFSYTPRVCFWPSLASIIALGMLWCPLWVRVDWRLRFACGGVAIILCVVHLLFVINWQTKYWHQNRDILSLLERSERSTVYYDIISPWSLPKLTLNYPSKSMWVSEYNYETLSAMRDYPLVAVVPSSLRDATPDNAKRLRGNVPAFSTGDALFVDSRRVPFLDIRGAKAAYIPVFPDCRLTLADGSEVLDSDALVLYYVNQPGDTLLYIRPYEIDPALVTGIDLSPENLQVNVY